MISKRENIDVKSFIAEKLAPYDLITDYPMKNCTSFHIGGEADFFVRPKSLVHLMNILEISKSYEYPVFVMGNGSNLLVSDKGIRAIVVQLSDNFSQLTKIDDETVEVESGMSMTSLSKYFLDNSLTGFEFACGIPGTIGGAVTMNAGAYDSMMSNVVQEVIVLDKDMNIKKLSNEQMQFSYRNSIISKKNLVVLSIRIKLKKGNFTEIKEKVLPQLRRSQIVFTKETVGKSDEEIAKLLNENPSKLSIEEMLYAANLNSDLNYKRDVFMKIVSQYPEDIRGYNNLGVVEYKLGNMAEANRNFTKALEINKNDAVANFNKASILIAQGNISEAKTYLGYAAGVGEDLNYANAAIAIAEGNYSKAVSLYGKSNTNNAALARILNKDYSGAKNILENIQTPDAKTYYLKSIVAARTNNVNDLVKSVTMAINADNSYKEKFLNDMEFRSFLTNDAFASLLK